MGENCSVISIIVSLLLGGIISYIISWYFHERRRLSINCVTTSIISNDSDKDEIKILYRNIPVEQLSYTKIDIKNVGNRVIYKKDLANEKILFKFNKNNYIYTTGPKNDTHKDIQSRIGNDGNNTAFVYFNFLEKKDSISFELLHDSSVNPTIKGRLIGGSMNETDNIKQMFNAYIFRFITSIVLYIIFASTFIYAINYSFSNSYFLVSGIVLLILLIMGIVFTTWIIDDFRTLRELCTTLKGGR